MELPKGPLGVVSWVLGQCRPSLRGGARPCADLSLSAGDKGSSLCAVGSLMDLWSLQPSVPSATILHWTTMRWALTPLHDLLRFHFSGQTFFLWPESRYFGLVVLAASVGHAPGTRSPLHIFTSNPPPHSAQLVSVPLPPGLFR